MPDTFRIFLSYDSVLSDTIIALKAELTKLLSQISGRGAFELFLDNDPNQPGIDSGLDWQQALDDAVAQADLMLVFVTDSYVQRAPCLDEFEKARARQAAREPVTMLPIALPLSTRIYQAKDLSSTQRESNDAAFFASIEPTLQTQAKTAVAALRRLQAVKGGVFIKKMPGDELYGEAASELAIRLQRERERKIKRLADAKKKAEAETAEEERIRRQQKTKRTWGAVLGLAAILLASGIGYLVLPDGPTSDEFVVADWETLPAGSVLFNGTARTIEALSEPVAGTDVFEQIGPGERRPEPSTTAPLESFEINGVLWYRYVGIAGEFGHVAADAGMELSDVP